MSSMASVAIARDPLQEVEATKPVLEEEEEEEELFEIDLEAVNSIPAPPHYWESYFTATSSALLANCLLPIADVSCAVPIPSTVSKYPFSPSEKAYVLQLSFRTTTVNKSQQA